MKEKFSFLPIINFFKSKYNKHITAKQKLQQLGLEENINVNRLYLPILDSKDSILFWVVLVLCYTFFSVAIGANQYEDWSQAIRVLIETLTISSLVIFSIVGYVSLSINRYEDRDYSREQIINDILLAAMILTPTMSLLARFILYVAFGYTLSWWHLGFEIMSNTVVCCFMIGLLSYYFRMQYAQIMQVQRRYNKKLIEQNEQLKARITPHFFFNLLNTMQYLIESDPIEAEAMVRHVSILYRASFDETKEVALMDEIELCEHYLSIEKYRFADKLQVAWELPDEDLLYDMVIVSLTLQIVIEKLIVFVVEMTTEAIHINIAIDWSNDLVKIQINTLIPNLTYTTISEHINEKLSFDNQSEILQQYYGEKATIKYQFDGQYLKTVIQYPLKDVATI